jgi:hypothetical protein
MYERTGIKWRWVTPTGRIKCWGMEVVAMYGRGLEKLHKQLMLNTLDCKRWKSFCLSISVDSVTTRLLRLKRYMDTDALFGQSPCGECDESRRAIQVLNYLNTMVVKGKIWPLPEGFDPRIEKHWYELTVKAA